MASAQPQQQTPSNPFDGFDAYSSVAALPPASSGGSVAGSVVSAAPGGMVQPSQQHAFQPATMQGQQHATAVPNGQNAWDQLVQNHVQVNPFAAPSVNIQGALVPSATPANPYALGTNNQPPSQQFGQQPQQLMMQQQPVMQQPQMIQQPMVLQQQPFVQQQMVHVGASNSWAVAPAAGNHMMPPPTTPMQSSQQLVTAPASNDPFGIFEAPAPPRPVSVPATPQQLLENQMQTLHFNDNTPGKHSIVPNEDEEEGLALIDVELDEDESTNKFEGVKEEESDRESDKKEAMSPRRKDKNADIAPPPPMPPGRENAEFLSRNQGMITSPLPRPSLVLHAGYVLSRISFRTVLLRKWKQTFWIQYGPTQLLFFRSYADFGDWLNNPYHTAKAREYLVKLRVDFVSDLKKKSVMGYQVTQIRRKPYGKNVMLHFKLERWMDYGPTIAAAFAARQEEMIQSDYYKNNKHERSDEDGGMNTTNDVSALRKIILGCMRNARDQALLASQERMNSPMQQPEYQGRYAEDESTRQEAGRQNDGSAEKFHAASQSSKAGLYHQAFAAESSERRKWQGGDTEQNDSSREISQSESSNEVAKQEAVTQVVDLLG